MEDHTPSSTAGALTAMASIGGAGSQAGPVGGGQAGATGSNSSNSSITNSSAAAVPDQNMHFDTTSGKWMYEDLATGQEYEWNTVANAWVPVADEEELKKQQAAYSIAGVDESTPAQVLLQRDKKKLQKKRKAGEGDDTTGGDAGAESGGGAGATASTSALPAAKPKRAKPAARNTAVYVTGLPRDATAAEVSGVFSKAGLILLDAEGQPKIKLYTDSGTGVRNGDGLVVYYNEGSVTLAQELLDDTPLRLGDEQNRMKVAKADWGHKTTPANGADAQDGDNGQQKKRKGKMTNEEAKKMQRRAERLQKEAADYDPSYDEKDAPEALTAVVPAATSASASGGSAAGAGAAKAKAAGGRVVVLAHVFTLQELAEDASLLLDLKEDVREECEGLGKVTNLVLYDKEENGIVTVKFADPISAQACVLKNNDRFFGGRQLKAWLYDGKTRYQKSGRNEEAAQREGETEEEAEKRRLAEFGKWLEDEE